VAKFNPTLIPAHYQKKAITQYQGSPIGFLRGKSNLVPNPFTTRFPKSQLRTSFDQHQNLAYTQADFDLCSGTNWIRDWMMWQACVENARVHLRQRGDSFWNYESGLHWLHSQIHAKIGSFMGKLPDEFPFVPSNATMFLGDMMDVATSPNDPLFIFHHANVDRMNLDWLHNMEKIESEKLRTIQHKNRSKFGFPANYSAWLDSTKGVSFWEDVQAKDIWKSAVDGCQLYDVISSNFPFTNLVPTPNNRGRSTAESKFAPHTHYDLLQFSTSDSITYTYAI